MMTVLDDSDLEEVSMTVRLVSMTVCVEVGFPPSQIQGKVHPSGMIE